MTTQTFAKWIDTFTAEKGLDLDQVFNVPGASGNNSIPLGCVIEAMKSAPAGEQEGIRSMVAKIDFRNGDVCHYFRHLAQAIAI